jgi:uncharacterized protein (TIGR02145 family)
MLTDADAALMTRNYHGGWYKFGAKNPSIKNTSANNGIPSSPDWSDTDAYPFQNVSKDWYAVNNPCPAGWRVPDVDEWAAVTNKQRNGYIISNLPANNNVLFWSVGDWSSKGYMKIGPYLYLPAAGCQYSTTDANYSGGKLLFVGNTGYYRSGSAYSSVWFLDFYKNVVSIDNNSKIFGYSVRCVAVE